MSAAVVRLFVSLARLFSLYRWSLTPRFCWNFSAAVVHLTSARPHSISGVVTPINGLHSALAIDIVCRFLSIQFFTLSAVARWVVSIPILGPSSLALAQSISGVKDRNQGYPTVQGRHFRHLTKHKFHLCNSSIKTHPKHFKPSTLQS